MTKPHKQGGFSIFELVLIVVIVGVLVLGGIYVSKHRKNSSSASTTATTISSIKSVDDLKKAKQSLDTVAQEQSQTDTDLKQLDKSTN